MKRTKKKAMKSYHIRIPDELASRIKLVADTETESMNGIMIRLFGEALEAREHGLRPAIDPPEPPLKRKELAALIAGVMNDQRRLMREDFTHMLRPIYREAGAARRFVYRVIQYMGSPQSKITAIEDLARVRSELDKREGSI